MSPVERVHALWSAFESGGPLATLDLVDEECEWVPATGFPRAHPIRGQAALRARARQLARAGVSVEPALHSCEVIGDSVVVNGRIRIVSPAALTDSPLHWVYRVRDGRIVRIESYASRREALDAA